MLHNVSISGDKQLPSTSLYFSPTFSAVIADVRTGKSMLMRDILFQMLAGRAPGKRTSGDLGKKYTAACTMVNGDASLSVLKVKGALSIPEQPNVKGAAAVKQAVEQFTGIPSANLASICYATGITLPGDICTDGALLRMLRASLGDGPARMLKDVNAQISMLREPDLPPMPDEDKKSLIARQVEAQAKLDIKRSQLEENRETLDMCHTLSTRPRAADVQAQIAKYEASTKAAGSMRSSLMDYVQNKRLYEFAAQVRDEFERRGGQQEILTQYLPVVWQYSEVVRAIKDMASDNLSVEKLLADMTALDKLRAAQTLSDEEYKHVHSWFEWEKASQNEIQEWTRAKIQAETKLQEWERYEASADKIMAERSRVRHLRERLELVRSCLLPSGEFSIEKQANEQVMQNLLGFANYLLCTAGFRMAVQYSAEHGLAVTHERGTFSAAALSGSEVMMTSIALRLAKSVMLDHAPFLILDDVTGPLGAHVPDLCTMLRYCSAITGMQIILLSADPRVSAETVLDLR